MSGTYNKSFQEHKDMYVFNLDITRIFWLIAVSLFMVTFFFLFGYWLGSDTKYLALPKESQNVDHKKWIKFDKQELQKFASIKEQLVEQKSLADEENQTSEVAANSYKAESEEERLVPSRTQSVNRDITNRSIRTSLKDHRLTKVKPYTIQVSINRVRENAYRLRDKLINKGFSAYIFSKSSNGRTLNFVRVGPFVSEVEAQRVQHSLRRDKSAKDCIVVNR